MTVEELQKRFNFFRKDEEIVFTEHDGKQYKEIAVFAGEEGNTDGTVMMNALCPVEKTIPRNMKFVCDVTVTDPDTGGDVVVCIYKDPDSEGMFGVDASYLDQDDDVVFSPFSGEQVVCPE